MALLNCPECDHAISEQAKTCPQCGLPMTWSNRAAARNKAKQKDQQKAAAVEAASKPKPKAKRRIWPAILAGLFVLMVLSGIVEKANKAASTNAAADMPATDAAQDPRAGLYAKVDKGVFDPYTKDQYPKLFQKYGTRMKEIQAAREDAAFAAAASSKCDRVELAEVSSKGTKTDAVFFVDCKNGERFYISESDLRGKVAASPQSSKGVNESQAHLACQQAIRQRLQYPSSADFSMFGVDISKGKATGNLRIALDFEAKNGFGNMMPHRGVCIVDTDGNMEVSIGKR